MKARNDCEIACDCVKRANVVLHVRLCKEILARKHTATHKPTSAQPPHSDFDDTHTRINRLWSPLAYGLGGNNRLWSPLAYVLGGNNFSSCTCPQQRTISCDGFVLICSFCCHCPGLNNRQDFGLLSEVLFFASMDSWKGKSAFTPAGKKGLHESCPAHVTFPPRFTLYFRWRPCQAGIFPPESTLFWKYRIERGGQKHRSTSRSVFLSFLMLSGENFGDGRKLIPKTNGNRKRDCAWGCSRGINTTWENLQIEKHKSVRWAERTPSWFVLFDLQIFSGGVYPPSASSRTISFSTSNSFWH